MRESYQALISFWLDINPDAYTDHKGVRHGSCCKVSKKTGKLGVANRKELDFRIGVYVQRIQYHLDNVPEMDRAPVLRRVQLNLILTPWRRLSEAEKNFNVFVVMNRRRASISAIFPFARDDLEVQVKSSTVKYLVTATEEALEKDTKWAGEFGLPIRQILMDACARYTGPRGWDFNVIMLLKKFLREKNSSYGKARAEEQWAYFARRGETANVRLLAHLSAACSYDRDLVVYRGFKNPRPAPASREEALELFESAREVREHQISLDNVVRAGHVLSDAALLNLPTEDVPTFFNHLERIKRGIEQRIQDSAGYADVTSRDLSRLIHGAGDIYKSEGFMSASLSMETARQFMGEDCCLLQIMIPAGTPCVFASFFSAYGEAELEVILPPCSRLVVQSRRDGMARARCLGLTESERTGLLISKSHWLRLADLDGKRIAKQYIDAASRNEPVRGLNLSQDAEDFIADIPMPICG